MRIVGGALKGRKLCAPKGMRTRPTSDRVKVALFNILGPPPQGAMALDLFAGTGALGLEALSRGCDRSVFVERNRDALAALDRNLANLGVEERTEVMRCDVEVALRRLREPRSGTAPKGGGHQFSWVFLDPPYGLALEGVLDRLGELCAVDGCVVIEHSARDAAPSGVAFEIADSRRYGDTALTFLRPRAVGSGHVAGKGLAS